MQACRNTAYINGRKLGISLEMFVLYLCVRAATIEPPYQKKPKETRSPILFSSFSLSFSFYYNLFIKAKGEV